MISTQEALQKVMDTVPDHRCETIWLHDAVGRVLGEDIYADRPFPPFDRVTMDGIAIAYSSLSSGVILFPIEDIAPAGHPQITLSDKRKCIEVMTGAVLPSNTDTVIRYEDLEKTHDAFVVKTDAVKRSQNIHIKGSDHNENSILLQKGHKIKAIDINILATVGKDSVVVRQNPKVVILSSGDELVPIEEVPLPHQIRMSNVHMLRARLQELGVDSDHRHITDDRKVIEASLSGLISDYDVILMSGGVSKGKFDFIPEALEKLGVEKIFHRVAQRPGKPFWFGKNSKVTVFAFPGNPVSTLSCFHKYFIPWLSQLIGTKYTVPSVILKHDISFSPNLTYFAQGKISFERGQLYVESTKGNGSGDMVHPSQMDGFLELPQGKDVFEAGEVYNFIPFHAILK